jgi:hypothetical protein
MPPLLDAPGPGTDLLGVEPQFNAFPAGSSYGTLLHDLLEWQARNGWACSNANPFSGLASPAKPVQSQRLKLPAEHQIHAGWLGAADHWCKYACSAHQSIATHYSIRSN